MFIWLSCQDSLFAMQDTCQFLFHSLESKLLKVLCLFYCCWVFAFENPVSAMVSGVFAAQEWIGQVIAGVTYHIAAHWIVFRLNHRCI